MRNQPKTKKQPKNKPANRSRRNIKQPPKTPPVPDPFWIKFLKDIKCHWPFIKSVAVWITAQWKVWKEHGG